MVEDRDPVRYCDHVVGYGKSFFELVRKAGLEGMVAKRCQSPYTGGPSTDWLKVKCLRRHDFVIGGWLAGDTKRGPRALLLGELFGEALHYVGSVEDGFDRRRLRQIVLDLQPRKTSPFADPIQNPAARFCEPSVRVPIEFAEFTDDGHLRRPALNRAEYMGSARRRAMRLKLHQSQLSSEALTGALVLGRTLHVTRRSATDA